MNAGRFASAFGTCFVASILAAEWACACLAYGIATVLASCRAFAGTSFVDTAFTALGGFARAIIVATIDAAARARTCAVEFTTVFAFEITTCVSADIAAVGASLRA